MTRQQAKDLLPIIAAYAEGKTIQARRTNQDDTWDDQWPDVHFDAPNLDYRIKPDPRLRPWTAEEVPVGKLIKRKGQRGTYTIVASDTDGDVWIGTGEYHTRQEVLENFTMEDGSPCGITENP